MNVKKVYDLSVDVEPGMATWPTNPEIVVKEEWTYEKDQYKEEVYSSSTHTGTHIDAPAHMYKGGLTVDQLDLKVLVSEGYCIRPKFHGTEIRLEDIRKVWDEKYNGRAILINTGWDKKRAKNEEWQFKFPGLAEDTVDFFGNKSVKLIGIDTLGIEPADHETFPVHKGLEKHGITFIEDMANLEKLEVGKPYLIAALPVKIKGASGSMCRTIAIDA
jgi:kynurenine formamidase